MRKEPKKTYQNLPTEDQKRRKEPNPSRNYKEMDEKKLDLTQSFSGLFFYIPLSKTKLDLTRYPKDMTRKCRGVI